MLSGHSLVKNHKFADGKHGSSTPPRPQRLQPLSHSPQSDISLLKRSHQQAAKKQGHGRFRSIGVTHFDGSSSADDDDNSTIASTGSSRGDLQHSLRSSSSSLSHYLEMPPEVHAYAQREDGSKQQIRLPKSIGSQALRKFEEYTSDLESIERSNRLSMARSKANTIAMTTYTDSAATGLKDAFLKEGSDFDSIALFIETRYMELKNFEGAGVEPTRFKAAAAADMMTKLCQHLGRYSNVMKPILWELYNCIFVDFPSIEKMYQNRPESMLKELIRSSTYFEHCDDLLLRFEELKVESDLIHQGLQMKDIIKRYQTVRLAFKQTDIFVRDACFFLWRGYVKRKRHACRQARLRGLRLRFRAWKAFVKNRGLRTESKLSEELDTKINRLMRLNENLLNSTAMEDPKNSTTTSKRSNGDTILRISTKAPSVAKLDIMDEMMKDTSPLNITRAASVSGLKVEASSNGSSTTTRSSLERRLSTKGGRSSFNPIKEEDGGDESTEQPVMAMMAEAIRIAEEQANASLSAKATAMAEENAEINEMDREKSAATPVHRRHHRPIRMEVGTQTQFEEPTDGSFSSIANNGKKKNSTRRVSATATVEKGAKESEDLPQINQQVHVDNDNSDKATDLKDENNEDKAQDDEEESDEESHSDNDLFDDHGDDDDEVDGDHHVEEHAGGEGLLWVHKRLVLSPRDTPAMSIETACDLISFIYEQLYIDNQTYLRSLRRQERHRQREHARQAQAQLQHLAANNEQFAADVRTHRQHYLMKEQALQEQQHHRIKIMLLADDGADQKEGVFVFEVVSKETTKVVNSLFAQKTMLEMARKALRVRYRSKKLSMTVFKDLLRACLAFCKVNKRIEVFAKMCHLVSNDTPDIYATPYVRDFCVPYFFYVIDVLTQHRHEEAINMIITKKIDRETLIQQLPALFPYLDRDQEHEFSQVMSKVIDLPVTTEEYRLSVAGQHHAQHQQHLVNNKHANNPLLHHASGPTQPHQKHQKHHPHLSNNSNNSHNGATQSSASAQSKSKFIDRPLFVHFDDALDLLLGCQELDMMAMQEDYRHRTEGLHQAPYKRAASAIIDSVLEEKKLQQSKPVFTSFHEEESA